MHNNGDSETLAFRAFLHIGEVYYVNIGSKNRLDFTAIGPVPPTTARNTHVSTLNK